MCLLLCAEFYVSSRPSSAKFLEWIGKYKIEYYLYYETLYKAPETPYDGDNDPKLLHIAGFNKRNHANLERRFGTTAREIYAMTKCGFELCVPVEDKHMVGSGSCGIPAPYREVMIADDDGKPVVPNEVGELWVRGPGIMLGCHNRPETNAEIFRCDWFRTGDLFRQDRYGSYPT